MPYVKLLWFRSIVTMTGGIAMKSVTSIILVLMVAAPSAVAGSFNDIDLEPALNGGVSASGLFPTQDLEDRYGVRAAPGLEYDERNLEPAFNGDVSASGLFPTQEAEDRASEETKRMLSEMSRNR